MLTNSYVSSDVWSNRINYYFRNLHIRLGHGILIRPPLDLLEVPAHMLALVVWPIALLPLDRVECKHIDVGETHEVHA